ncbi:nitroreductase family protein [Saccharopolyspora pogona]|uniref:nitroreductase family protein n=1 Tax=Saccharopolyspora pogona TaxID=333966 RepID=UPI001CC25A64|nr:nitroreductase family protein [Saccharopolyspora pogona]
MAESSWNLHTTAVARFYEWAVEEGHAEAVPFTYAWAKRFVDGQVRTMRRNLAKLKGPKPATTIKYLEQDFAELFVRALEGLLPDGAPDPAFRGHDPGRNAAMTRFGLEFYGAPHAAFLFMPKFGDGVRAARDIGMYAQNFLLSLAARGFDGVPQTHLGFYADTVRDFLRSRRAHAHQNPMDGWAQDVTTSTRASS